MTNIMPSRGPAQICTTNWQEEERNKKFVIAAFSQDER
jgi:hypothetical protein